MCRGRGRGILTRTFISNFGVRVKIFYSRDGQTADSLIERLAAKYAANCDVTVATDDHLERTTVEAFGATSISSRQLQSEIEAAGKEVQVTIQRLCGRQRL